MTHSKETRDKFIEMRAEARTLAKIAKELVISRNTATKWDRDLQDDIKAASAFNTEEMMEKYRMTKKKRIEMYGEKLLAMEDELSRRDFADISTPKLCEMIIKYSKALEAEIDKPKFLTDDDIKEKRKTREANREMSKRMSLNRF
jgi:hypothetical protein